MNNFKNELLEMTFPDGILLNGMKFIVSDSCLKEKRIDRLISLARRDRKSKLVVDKSLVEQLSSLREVMSYETYFDRLLQKKTFCEWSTDEETLPTQDYYSLENIYIDDFNKFFKIFFGGSISGISVSGNVNFRRIGIVDLRWKAYELKEELLKKENPFGYHGFSDNYIKNFLENDILVAENNLKKEKIIRDFNLEESTSRNICSPNDLMFSRAGEDNSYFITFFDCFLNEVFRNIAAITFDIDLLLKECKKSIKKSRFCRIKYCE